MADRSAAADLLLDVPFTASEVTGLRHRIVGLATGVGLGGERLDDFVLAAYELLTNAVRHGGGAGRLRLVREPARLLCVVADDGVGFTDGSRLPGDGPPVPTSPGGLGLFLAERLTDGMEIDSARSGTTVCIFMTTESEQSALSYPTSFG